MVVYGELVFPLSRHNMLCKQYVVHMHTTQTIHCISLQVLSVGWVPNRYSKLLVFKVIMDSNYCAHALRARNHGQAYSKKEHSWGSMNIQVDSWNKTRSYELLSTTEKVCRVAFETSGITSKTCVQCICVKRWACVFSHQKWKVHWLNEPEPTMYCF